MGDETKKSVIKLKINKSVIVYILLSIIILALLGYILYTGRDISFDTNRSTFVKNIFEAQSKLSYYLGKTSAETFGIYSNDQIIIGSKEANNVESTKIKFADGTDITPLVSTSSSDKGYLIIDENFKKVIEVELQKFDGVSYYIYNGDSIKVSFDVAPRWWDKSLDTLKISK